MVTTQTPSQVVFPYLTNRRQGSLGAWTQQEITEGREVDIPQATDHEATDASTPRRRFLLQQVKRDRRVALCLTNNSNKKVKCKVVPVLFLTEHHAMKAYWGVEV
jgi:hypothetical protein